MRLFGILLIVVILLASGGYVYLASQDWKGRQAITAAAFRHLLLLQGLPVEGEGFAADDETAFVIPLTGGEQSRTVSKKLLEGYFNDNTRAAAAPAAGADAGPARAALATSAAVVSQEAEVRRVHGVLKGELSKDAPAAAKAALAGGWLLLQAETMDERAEYRRLIAAGDADALAHLLDRRFYRVAPKLYQSSAGALAPGQWEELQARAEGGAGRPPVSADEGDRRDRIAHLLAHLDPDAAWQKRVAAVVGLRRYVAAIAAQAARFREMRAQAELPLASDQAAFQRHYDLLLNEARQNVDRARATAEERRKLEDQKTAADDAVSRRDTQLKDLRAQLAKVQAEVDRLLVEQGGIERELYEIQREVALTLDEVYRLEALLIAAERERAGGPPAARP